MNTKAIAATYDAAGALFVLTATGSRSEVAKLERGKKTTSAPAVTGVTRLARVAALPSGAVLSVSREGKSLLVTASGEKKPGLVGEVVFDVSVIDGVAYAATARGGLFELEETTGEWWVRGAFEDLLKKRLKTKVDESDVHSVVATRSGLIAVVAAGDRTLLIEQEGKKWRCRAELKQRVNAIASCPETDTLYTVGDDFYAVDAEGKVVPVPNPDELERDHWSAWWANGELVVGTLFDVESVNPRTGKTKRLLAPSPGAKDEVGHNHALASNGESVAFVRAGALFVLKGGRFQRVRLT